MPRATRSQKKAQARRTPEVPDIYQEVLADALATSPQDAGPSRPAKKRRGGRGVIPSGKDSKESSEKELVHKKPAPAKVKESKDKEPIPEKPAKDRAEELVEDEESLLGSDAEPETRAQQTVFLDSDESDYEESDVEFEDVNFQPATQDDNGGEGPSDLNLTLSSKAFKPTAPQANRRKPVTKAERDLRLQTHKMHVLCLLAYVDLRNNWCNDFDVQEALKPLLTKKMVTYLKPKKELPAFGRAESLKNGLAEVVEMWSSKFKITARGMRRPVWFASEQDIQKFKLPKDAEEAMEKDDFQRAAKKLEGSRDTGAQLFCALLRSIGLNARLVCSLQPLPFGAAAKAVSLQNYYDDQDDDEEEEANPAREPEIPSPVASSSARRMDMYTNPRARLGHPNAAAYNIPIIRTPPNPVVKPKDTTIYESPYPILWVEVLETAHKKWHPVDPLVTGTVARPRSFEPPLSDLENRLLYVIAFEEEGIARDVTRRYAKAYNSKTRKQRVESTKGGDKWWRRAMKLYSRGYKTDFDEVEATELAAAEAREPMPKNVIDFKDHPTYALERHLRRNEVLANRKEIGKVAAGKDKNAPGGKKMESVYRRSEVKIARSADAWYRLGRDVKAGEQPVKFVVPRRKAETEVDAFEEVREQPGTGLYTEAQTELYVAPPVVNGRVPKNSYGNLDVYVKSMVPPGGVHIADPLVSRAARILSIDYADAVTGFEFKGRRGTAVVRGAVIAKEYQEAVETVLQGFKDELETMEEERRRLAILNLWKRFVVGLRIKQRVDGYYAEGEDAEKKGKGAEEGKDEAEDSGRREKPEEEDSLVGEEDMESEEHEYFDDGEGGGFLLD